jgi:hypothetical protein
MSETRRLAEEAMDRMVRQSEWMQDMVKAEPKGFMRDVVQDQRRNVLHQDKLISPLEDRQEYKGPRIGGGPASPEAHALYLERRRIRGEI